jgi:DNA-binding CsgD family transcriptional regulator/tetratricopeptide (TPR) repeat protein
VSTSSAPRAKPPLIGRQREAALLWQRYETAMSGQLVVALASGEPGIGKTRLLDEIAARASDVGTRVLRGAATEAEGMPPYLPFVEALGRHIRAETPEALRAQTETTAPILATLLPELPQRLGSLPESYPLPPEQARLRLYEAVGDWLATLAAEHPLLVMLDDLQWADPATYDLLSYIAGHCGAAQLMLLGAHRQGETTHPQAFERALATLHRLRILTTVALPPLSPAEVASLAHERLAGTLEPATSRVLFRQSEGNPFFAEELLRSWLESNALRRGASLRACQTGAADWSLPASAEVQLPPSIQTTIRQRLIRLPGDALDLLRVAAIIGRTFEVSLLAEAFDCDAETVEERLSVAIHAQLICPGDPGTLKFAHDKIRECLYAEVTAARRTRLHAQIGTSLAARPDTHDPRRIADLAFHFTRSGDRERGVDYARRAAESAMTAYAFEEATTHYHDALELLDGGDIRRGTLLLALGEANIFAGAEREAMSVLRLAQTALQSAGNLAAAAQASHALGRAAWRLEEVSSAQAAFEETLALLGAEPTPERVCVLVDLGSLLGVTMHRYAEGLAYGREALALAEQFRDERLIAPAARTVGNLLVRSNDLEAGIPLLEHALALAEGTVDFAEAAECCACLVLAYLWSGDIERTLSISERRADYARQCHDPHQMRHAYTMTAIFDVFDGQMQRAVETLSQAEQIIERLADPEPLAYLRFVQGGVALHRGDYAQAEANLEAACRIFRAIGPGALVWFLGWLVLAYARRGKISEAREACDELETLLADIPPNSMPMLEALVPLSEAACVLEDHQLAMRIYPQLLAFRMREGDFLPERLLGQLATLQQDWLLAQDHLTAAERRLRDANGAPRRARTPELARTLAAQAQLERARHGKSAQPHAGALLSEALELMRRVGMEGEAANVARELEALPGMGERVSRPTLPDHLTRREAEVLHLLAAGADNQRIAATLVLSVRTVERHISNIYAKIGADGTASRAVATAYALRNGLL